MESQKKQEKWIIFIIFFFIFVAIAFAETTPMNSNLFIDPAIEKELKISPEVQVVVSLEELKSKNSFQKAEIFNKKLKYVKIDEVKAVNQKRLQLLNKFISDLPNDKFQIHQTSITGRWFITTIDKNTLEELKSNPKIKSITLPQIIKTSLDDSVPLIEADEVWDMDKEGVNLNGSGQSVCVIDTGVDSHSNLSGQIIAEQCFCWELGFGGCCPNEQDTDDNADDGNGHGTHVAGIIASTDNTYKGVAPGSKIVAVKFQDENGNGINGDLANAIDWCVENANEYNISVISLSLGINLLITPNTYETEFGCELGTFLTQGPIEDAIATGLTVVAATGPGEEGTTDPEGVSSPACLPHVIGVGSSDKNDAFVESTNGKNSNLLDLLAPGNYITSLKLGGGTIAMSGTSMAAPHVSGAAALLLQRDSSLVSDQIKKLLQQTGDPVVNSTKKRINIKTAMSTYYPSTLDVKYRDVYQSQTLTFDLENIGVKQNGKQLKFIITWTTSKDDLDLVIQDPTGGKHTVVNSSLGEFYLSDPITSALHGTWKINVTGKKVEKDFVDFKLGITPKTPDADTPGAASGTGGINFTSLNLNYINTCDSNNLQFVMKGKEAQTGDTIINITNATVNAMDYFLTGLVIPDDKIWITMVFKSSCGDVLLITFVRENPMVESLSESGKEIL